MTSNAMIPSHSEPFRSILLFGPPGSGKGTLGKFLSSAGNHFHLSSGDIFRGLSFESPAGKLYHNYAGKGLLVPDEITIQIWDHYVHGLIATNRYFPSQQLLLLDGIPRTAPQAAMLSQHVDIQKIIVLEVKDHEVLVQRLLRRALIEKRMDDMDPSILRTRLDVYQRETIRLLDHYPNDWIVRFNAAQKPLEVLRDVLASLSDLLSK
ncbi:MAG: adenylate kinase [Chlamydiota bacterium]